ncbi:hypothetical protein ACTFIW_000909, partial [Dictyostelium discoideum]
F